MDGYYQFIFDKNLLGYEKYRVDRISGFFKDDLILGSFLSRLLPLFIGLTLFFKNDLKFTTFNLVIFLSALIVISSVSILILNNATVFDRYVDQTKKHILGLSNDLDKDSRKILPYYMPMFETSFKMFKENKILGMGPKSFRYLCDDKRFVSYFDTIQSIDNTVIKIKKNWKEKRQFKPQGFYVEEGDIIKKKDKIFAYRFDDNKKIHVYLSDKEG